MAEPGIAVVEGAFAPLGEVLPPAPADMVTAPLQRRRCWWWERRVGRLGTKKAVASRGRSRRAERRRGILACIVGGAGIGAGARVFLPV